MTSGRLVLYFLSSPSSVKIKVVCNEYWQCKLYYSPWFVMSIELKEKRKWSEFPSWSCIERFLHPWVLSQLSASLSISFTVTTWPSCNFTLFSSISIIWVNQLKPKPNFHLNSGSFLNIWRSSWIAIRNKMRSDYWMGRLKEWAAKKWTDRKTTENFFKRL